MRFKKDFNDSFFFFLEKITNKENFAFVRFSDGELDIIQNLYVELGGASVQRGNELLPVAPYPAEDHKIFDPTNPAHQGSRQKLLDSLKFRKKNYFKGLTCPCCVSADRVRALLDLYEEGDEEHLVWSNQFVNSNYIYFLDHIYKHIQKREDIILVGNERIDPVTIGLRVKKFFPVGYNCFVNNIDLSDEIKKYILTHNIKNHLFLFSAASLSEILIYELYKDYPDNTYIDIGTTLHKQLGLSIRRDYLSAYWNRSFHPDLHKKCIYPLEVIENG